MLLLLGDPNPRHPIGARRDRVGERRVEIAHKFAPNRPGEAPGKDRIDKLILAGATDQEAAEVMGWSPDQVQGIRRMCVDQDRIGMAIAERLSGVR